MNQALSPESEYQNQSDSALACYQRLGGAQSLEAFNSGHQVADVTGLMAASGKQNWNIWAVSYGTRTAMHVLRQAPATLRSVVLDSAFPPEVNGFLAKPEQLARALESIVAACEQGKACRARYPQLASQINNLLAQTGQAPIKIEFLQSVGMAPVSLAVTDLRLLWMLFFDSYLNHFETDTANAVARASRGQKSALEPMAQRYVHTLLDTSFSSAVYFAVTCAEDWPGVTQAAYHQALARHPRVAAYLRPEWQYAVCRFWDSGTLPAQFNAPVVSSVPMLFLSGEFDPATLPEWAQVAVQRLPEAHLVEFQGASHAVTFSNGCAMRSAEEFMHAPDAWRAPPCAQEINLNFAQRGMKPRRATKGENHDSPLWEPHRADPAASHGEFLGLKLGRRRCFTGLQVYPFATVYCVSPGSGLSGLSTVLLASGNICGKSRV